MGLPPPRAMTACASISCASANPAATSAVVGLVLISVNGVMTRPSSLAPFVIISTRPISANPGSLTSSTRLQASVVNSARSASIAG